MGSGRGLPHLGRKGSPSGISRWESLTYGEREGVIYIWGKRWPFCGQESSPLSCQKTPTQLYGRDYTGGNLNRIPAPPLLGKWGSSIHLPRDSAAARETPDRPSKLQNGLQRDGSAGARPKARPTALSRAAPAWERPASEGRGRAQRLPWGRPGNSPGVRDCGVTPHPRGSCLWRPPSNCALGHSWLCVLGPLGRVAEFQELDLPASTLAHGCSFHLECSFRAFVDPNLANFPA